MNSCVCRGIFIPTCVLDDDRSYPSLMPLSAPEQQGVGLEILALNKNLTEVSEFYLFQQRRSWAVPVKQACRPGPWTLPSYNERLIVRGREKAVNSQESNGLLNIGREKKDASLLTGIKREKREPELHGKNLSSRVWQFITSIIM